MRLRIDHDAAAVHRPPPMIWRVVFLWVCASSLVLRADEGYWLFTNPPTAAIADRYHVTVDAGWLDHLQRTVVKIGGATGSFVSADGLVITNRHVGEGQLHTLSTPRLNYEKDGFFAPTRTDEIPCQGLEMRVLESTENVTAQVTGAVPADASPETAEAAHRAIEAALEKESFARTGLTSEVVTLFGGARYDLYRYQKYPDVRLVFAPEEAIGFFGGDADNFEFPRYDFDVCLFRIYDHGHPLKSHDFLKFNGAGPSAGETIFVAGHPASSQRLVTMDELRYQRDVRLPRSLATLRRMERKLTEFGETSPEHAREAASALAGVANSRKAFAGFLAGLSDPALFSAKAVEEKSFRDLLAKSPRFQKVTSAYDRIRDAVTADRRNQVAYDDGERFASHSDLMNLARTLVRAAAERSKPNAARLPAYRDSALPSLEFRLFSGRPFYPDLEQLFLRDALEQLVTDHDPVASTLLAGESVDARAKSLVQSSRLEDVAHRRALYAGGTKALTACNDPMIRLATAIDPESRAARKIDDDGEESRRQAYAEIYQARVDLDRAPKYPDATGTLRLAYGTVSGFEAAGKKVPPFTDFGGLFDHASAHKNKPPFAIPTSWCDARPQLQLQTPFNFVTSADILGGNSGSPVVNSKGEFVGIIFDGNAASLAGRYQYDPEQNRSVTVDSAAIFEVLRKVYHAGALADELESGHAR